MVPQQRYGLGGKRSGICCKYGRPLTGMRMVKGTGGERRRQVKEFLYYRNHRYAVQDQNKSFRRKLKMFCKL